jgi:hypothetical protein
VQLCKDRPESALAGIVNPTLSPSTSGLKKILVTNLCQSSLIGGKRASSHDASEGILSGSVALTVVRCTFSQRSGGVARLMDFDEFRVAIALDISCQMSC